MVRRTAVMLSLWLLGVCAARAEQPRLWLDLPEATAIPAQTGRPITVLARYRGPADLDALVSVPWRVDFAVQRGYAYREDGDQVLRLRLTPRRTGELALPSLSLGDALTRPRTITVTDAVENGTPLVPHWTVSTTSPWQHQQVVLRLGVATTDPDAHLAVDLFRPDGFQVTPLPSRVTAEGETRFTWLLRPNRADAPPLRLPRLRYERDGVPLRRFHFPRLALQVRPLPPYVPPSVPVGTLRVAADDGARLDAQGMEAHTLTSALARAGLPAVVQATQDDSGVSLATARIDWQRATPDDVGVVYFDTASGRLENIHPTPPASWPAWAAALVMAGLLVVGWRRRAWLRHAWRLWRYRRHIRVGWHNASDNGARITLLLSTPLPGKAQRPRTLQQWCAAYGQLRRLQAADRDRLAVATDALTRSRYAGHAASDDAELQALGDWL